MGILYNFFLTILLPILYVGSFFNKKINKWLTSRRNQTIPKNLDGPIWIHAASLGEFEQGRSLIEAIKKQWPSKKIALTFFSSSGYEARKNYAYADWVGYIPYDKQSKAKKFIEALDPCLAIFIKYEFWYHHLKMLDQKKIPFIFISSYWWQDHFLLKPWNKWLLKKALYADRIFVQDEMSGSFLAQTGYEKITIAGDTRIDRVLEIKNEAFTDVKCNQLLKYKPVLVAGSTWAEDEVLLANLLQLNNEYALVVAPHDVSKKRIDEVMIYFKAYKPKILSHWNGEDFKVMIIDQLGLLNKLYRFASVAYVGGGFGKGIHNTLEAVVYGIPVFYGPHHKAFKEAIDFTQSGIGFSINNSQEMNAVLQKLDESTLDKIKNKSTEYFEQNAGATAKIIAYLHTQM